MKMRRRKLPTALRTSSSCFSVCLSFTACDLLNLRDKAGAALSLRFTALLYFHVLFHVQSLHIITLSFNNL
ncbi:unnamed protein product [Boreogadus saida]